jgi:hypothetical protein
VFWVWLLKHTTRLASLLLLSLQQYFSQPPVLFLLFTIVYRIIFIWYLKTNEIRF